MAPFQALYRYEPLKWKELDTSQAKVAWVKDHLEENKKVVQLLKKNLVVVRNCMMKQADQHQTKKMFEIGDWVFVRL